MAATLWRVSRAELLRSGAQLLESRVPATQATFRVVAMNPLRCRARFDWPGVVTVRDDNTGELLARSKPGKPSEPDAWTLAQDRRERGT